MFSIQFEGHLRKPGPITNVAFSVQSSFLIIGLCIGELHQVSPCNYHLHSNVCAFQAKPSTANFASCVLPSSYSETWFHLALFSERLNAKENWSAVTINLNTPKMAACVFIRYNGSKCHIRICVTIIQVMHWTEDTFEKDVNTMLDLWPTHSAC